MASTRVHHCGVEVDAFLGYSVFCVIWNGTYFEGDWFLSLLGLGTLRLGKDFLIWDWGLLLGWWLWALLFHFLLYFCTLFSILFSAFLCILSLLFLLFLLLLFLLFIPIKLSLSNKLGNRHRIIPINKFLIILCYLNSLTIQRQILELYGFLWFKDYRNCFASLSIQMTITWFKLKLLVGCPVEFYRFGWIVS